MLDIDADEDCAARTACAPAKCCLVDTAKGELVDDEHLKADYACRKPYGEWLDRNLVNLKDLKIPNERVPSHRAGRAADGCRKPSATHYEDVSDHASCRWPRTGQRRCRCHGYATPHWPF